MFDLGEEAVRDGAPIVVRDPRQEADMVVKLIGLKRAQILELQHIISEGEQNSRRALTFGDPELAHRYGSSTFKDFKNAVEFYQQLKLAGL